MTDANGKDFCGVEHLHFAIRSGKTGLKGTDGLFGAKTATDTPWTKK
jgi:hypothetical protein